MEPWLKQQKPVLTTSIGTPKELYRFGINMKILTA